MKILRTLRKLAAEVVATSPRKAAASIALMATVSVTEGVGLLLLMPLLGLVGISETSTMPKVDGWFAVAFKAVGMTPTLGRRAGCFRQHRGSPGASHALAVMGERSLERRVYSRMRVRVPPSDEEFPLSPTIARYTRTRILEVNSSLKATFTHDCKRMRSARREPRC